MKIENRVEVLENELKILKNEIQSTLLELREQVLNHYYPELRAEEPVKAKMRTERPAEARPSKGGQAKSNGNPRQQVKTNSSPVIEPKATVQPFSDLFLKDMDDLDDDELDDDDVDNYDADDDIDGDANDESDNDDEIMLVPHASPKTREVNLSQLKQAPAVPKAKAITAKAPIVAQEQKPNRRIFTVLAAWVGTSVAKVGKERTLQLVETYAASGGALTDATKNSILQLASLASEEEPTTPAGNQEMLGLMVELDHILGEP